MRSGAKSVSLRDFLAELEEMGRQYGLDCEVVINSPQGRSAPFLTAAEKTKRSNAIIEIY